MTDKPVVLIVDDTKTMRLLLQQCLQGEFSTIEAESGQQAIELFESHHPDVILLDVEMSGIDGFTTCLEIRKQEAGKHVPIMMITGLNDLASIAKAYEVGATDFTPKPIVWDTIPYRVHYMIRTSQQYSELQKSKLHLDSALSEIQTLNQELEKRVMERTQSLQEEMQKTEKLSKELITVARQVGMAEVATSILHNVGNVLNSVNVSAELAIEKITGFHLGDLAKLVELIKRHENDLADFITKDPKGKHLPEFLMSLTTVWQEEQDVILAELKNLSKMIEHIKEIVRLQEPLGQNVMLKEKTALAELLEDAIKISAHDIDNYGIQLERHYDNLSSVEVDKNKLLQVLVNLITNAKDSLKESSIANKTISISLLDQGSGEIEIQVQDNGLGIAADNLTKIFSYGFTTKKNGHGFGLHASALTIKQMGGTLNASSEGLGRGAVFLIRLPLKLLQDKKAQDGKTV